MRQPIFPDEVYTFYDENQIRVMLIASSFESVELIRVGDAFLAVALVASLRSKAGSG